jgi:hypothetical protein
MNLLRKSYGVEIESEAQNVYLLGPELTAVVFTRFLFILKVVSRSLPSVHR